jgi:tetratricopeptide (TPR) repeat protein
MLARAVRLQESGQAAQAIQLFETVLQKDPGNIDAMSGLGYCNLDRGNKGQAVTWFRRALGGGGGSFGPAIIGLAETYKSQGQKAEALKWYRRYLEVHPGGRDASLARSNIQRLEQEVGAEGRPAAADGAGDQPASDQPSDDSPYDKPVEKPADKPAGDSPYEKPADKPAADPPAEKPADKPAAASPDPYSAEG